MRTSQEKKDLAAKRRAFVERIVAVHVESHERMLALRDLLAFFERKDMHQWTVPEVLRLKEIRQIVAES